MGCKNVCGFIWLTLRSIGRVVNLGVHKGREYLDKLITVSSSRRTTVHGVYYSFFFRPNVPMSFCH